MTTFTSTIGLYTVSYPGEGLKMGRVLIICIDIPVYMSNQNITSIITIMVTERTDHKTRQNRHSIPLNIVMTQAFYPGFYEGVRLLHNPTQKLEYPKH